MMTHTEFLTTSPRGLNREHPALKMFQKAKKLGVWDPAAIDLRKTALTGKPSPTSRKTRPCVSSRCSKRARKA